MASYLGGSLVRLSKFFSKAILKFIIQIFISINFDRSGHLRINACLEKQEPWRDLRHFLVLFRWGPFRGGPWKGGDGSHVCSSFLFTPSSHLSSLIGSPTSLWVLQDGNIALAILGSVYSLFAKKPGPMNSRTLSLLCIHPSSYMGLPVTWWEAPPCLWQQIKSALKLLLFEEGSHWKGGQKRKAS